MNIKYSTVIKGMLKTCKIGRKSISKVSCTGRCLSRIETPPFIIVVIQSSFVVVVMAYWVVVRTYVTIGRMQVLDKFSHCTMGLSRVFMGKLYEYFWTVDYY